MTFLDKVKHYWLFISTFILALLTYLLMRRSSQIKDLQQQIILDKVNSQLKDTLTKSKGDEDAFQEELNRYNKLRDSYNKLYRSPPPSS